MDLVKTLAISASGMKAQGARLRVIAENIANADSVGDTKDGEPYRRKLITFKNTLDRATGVDTVRVNRVTTDKAEFPKRYDPSHPAADGDGYVRMPNVRSLMEVMDMREAERSYEANLRMIESAKQMLQRTIDVLRG